MCGWHFNCTYTSIPLSLSCAFSTDCGKQLLSIYGICFINNLCHCNCAVLWGCFYHTMCLRHLAGQLFTYLFLQEVSGVGPRARSIRVSSKGDGETGSVILGISDRLVSAMVQPGENQTKRSVKSPTVGEWCSSYLIVDIDCMSTGRISIKV